VSYFAAVLSRSRQDWYAAELDLDEVTDFDGLVEVASAAAADDFDVALISLEEDDEWLALARIDRDGETRVFLSDTRVLGTSEVAGLLADVLEPEGGQADTADEAESDADDEDTASSIDAEPGGDSALLADLGTTGNQLLALCAKEGALPGDITAEICDRAGCLDVYDSVRTT
jgi:putative tRNA adenosine deaminase-associated protein